MKSEICKPLYMSVVHGFTSLRMTVLKGSIYNFTGDTLSTSQVWVHIRQSHQNMVEDTFTGQSE